jgi:hypothetical protein
MPKGHDWTLKSIQYDWQEARSVFVFETAGASRILVANGIAELNIPQKREWGPSVSVNGIAQPSDIEGGLKKLTIEMQSGDTITAIAAEFSLELA